MRRWGPPRRGGWWRERMRGRGGACGAARAPEPAVARTAPTGRSSLGGGAGAARAPQLVGGDAPRFAPLGATGGAEASSEFVQAAQRH